MSRQSSFSGKDDHTSIPLEALRRFTRERKPARVSTEVCELCSTGLAPEHRHLLDLASRAVLCACNECAVLFGQKGSGGGTYRTIPRRYLALPDFQMSDEQWDQLMIPVNIVYMFQSTNTQRTLAFYPGPAGAMESLLDLEDWQVLVAQNPVLQELEADVEALLINRVHAARLYYVVPIDECYRLIGLIRMYWRGMSGGQEVWQMIEEFFEQLRLKARVVSDNTSSTLFKGACDA